MKKKIPIITLLVIFSLFLLPNVNALFPDSHHYIHLKICDTQTTTSPIKTLVCDKYPKEALAGDLITDISVVYYYTEDFTRYDITHSQNFCQRMIEEAENDRQLAVAYGVCLHQIHDSQSHNILVPHSIVNTLTPNAFIHPIAEFRVEELLLNEQKLNPLNTNKKALESQTRDALLIFQENGIENNQFIDQLKRALKPSPEYDTVNMNDLASFFIGQVRAGEGYQLGIQSFFGALPKSVFVFLGSVLFACIFFLYYLFKSKKRIWAMNYLLIPFLMFISILIIIAFIGLFTGRLFQFYEIAIKPISYIVPLGNWQSQIDNSVQISLNYFNTGILNVPQPSGFEAIKEAERLQIIVRIITLIAIGSVLAFLIFFRLLKIHKRKNR